jgi:hypothetical protein
MCPPSLAEVRPLAPGHSVGEVLTPPCYLSCVSTVPPVAEVVFGGQFQLLGEPPGTAPSTLRRGTKFLDGWKELRLWNQPWIHIPAVLPLKRVTVSEYWQLQTSVSPPVKRDWNITETHLERAFGHS